MPSLPTAPTWIILAASFLLLQMPTRSHAHPLMAEPINHPYIFTFDQFHLDVDGDESLLEGGLLLMAELNCLACHQAAKPWHERLAPRPGPDLSGVGSRLDADTIWLMVRSPQHRKKGTLMPGMFNGAEDDAEQVEAITQYLLTLKRELPQMPKGDPDRGKKLYHTVGCVACHEPATDYRPPSVPADHEVEKPGNASNPIALADAYNLQALSHFLLNPLADRPAGRMPSMHLSESEAADIAAYLHVGRTAERAQERAALQIAPQTAEAGRQRFIEHQCAVCHTTGSEQEKRQAMAFAKLRTTSTTGCLAAKPSPGSPRFDLNPLQRKALTLAIKHVQQESPAPQTANERIDWQMLRLNCYACHDRDGKGGPEDPRTQYFMAADSGAEALGDLARMPPTLDRTGWKLTSTWMHRALHGDGGAVRPYLSVRMPNFGEASTLMLPELFSSADQPAEIANPSASLTEKGNSDSGRRLMAATGLNCISCHGLQKAKSTGVPGINLSHTTERINASYFKALMLNPEQTQPGTLMPVLFTGREKASDEIEQIWSYLKDLEHQPLPEGMEKK